MQSEPTKAELADIRLRAKPMPSPLGPRGNEAADVTCAEVIALIDAIEARDTRITLALKFCERDCRCAHTNECSLCEVAEILDPLTEPAPSEAT